MANKRYAPQPWQLLVIAVLVSLSSGALCCAVAQGPNYDTKIARVNRSPNPRVNISRIATPHPGNPATKMSPAVEKREAIEGAIDAGNKARDRNEYEEALSQYEKAKHLNATEPRAYYGLGNLYSDFLCNDLSIQTYLKALEFDPEYPEALVALGYAYAKEEQCAKAEEQFRQVLAKQSGHLEANLGLGLVYAKQGRFEDGIAQINRVILAGSKGDQAKAVFARGDVYFGEEGNWTKAIAEYEKAISLKPDLAIAYVKLAFSQLWASTAKLDFDSIRDGDTQEMEKLRTSAKQATDNIKTAIRLKYTPPGVYSDLGITLAYQRKYDEAVENINQYLTNVGELKNRMPSFASGCSVGFSRIKAEGYVNLGFVSELQGIFESDKKKQNEFFEEAIKYYKQAITLKDDYGGAFSALGNIYLRMNRYEEAMWQYKQALVFLTSVTEKANTKELIARACQRSGADAEALEQIHGALKLKPNEPRFYESLASIYIAQGNLEATFEQLKKAKDLRTQLGLEAATDPHPYYYLGVTFSIRFMKKKDAKDFEEAINLLKKAVDLRPKNASYYEALGIVYEVHGDGAEALANYEKAIGFDPKNPDPYFHMADVYSSLKLNYDAAIERLRKVIELKPDNARAYQFLGAMYYRKKDEAEAIKSELKAIDLDPKYLQAYFDLASIYKNQKNYPEAIKYLKKAVGFSPTELRPYTELLRIYEDQEDDDAAIQTLKTIIGIKSDSAEAFWKLAQIYRRKHDDNEAIKYLLEAIRSDSNYEDAYFSLISIYKSQKDYSEAIKLLNRVFEFASTEVWPSKELAKIYEAQQRNDDAIKYYQQAIGLLKPGDTFARELYGCRIERLRRNYAQAIRCFQNLKTPDSEDPGQLAYDIGLTYVASGIKKAALAQYEQLKELKSSLAGELMGQIEEMK